MRARLKDATASLHAALHAAPPFLRLLDGTLERDRYVVLIQSLYCFHGGLHPLVEAGGALLSDPLQVRAARERLMLLRQDFLALEVEPCAPETPPEAGRIGPFALGALYVIQGSMLGGPELYRRLGRLLPGGQGRSFFRGGPTGPRAWRSLCAGLERHGSNQAACEELLAGARFAFGHFATCLGC